MLPIESSASQPPARQTETAKPPGYSDIEIIFAEFQHFTEPAAGISLAELSNTLLRLKSMYAPANVFLRFQQVFVEGNLETPEAGTAQLSMPIELPHYTGRLTAFYNAATCQWSLRYFIKQR